MKQSCDRYYEAMAMQESCNCEYQPDVLRNLALETNPKPCPFASVLPKGLQCSVAGLFCCDTTLCRRARTGMGTGFVAPASLFKRATAQRLRGPETVPNRSQQGLHTTMHSFRWLIEMLVPWFPHKNSWHMDFQTLAGIVFVACWPDPYSALPALRWHSKGPPANDLWWETQVEKVKISDPGDPSRLSLPIETSTSLCGWRLSLAGKTILKAIRLSPL